MGWERNERAASLPAGTRGAHVWNARNCARALARNGAGVVTGASNGGLRESGSGLERVRDAVVRLAVGALRWIATEPVRAHRRRHWQPRAHWDTGSSANAAGSAGGSPHGSVAWRAISACT